MKKIVTLLAVVMTFGLSAQSLQLVNADHVVYYDAMQANLDVPAHIKIKNISDSDKSYKVRRNGPFASFCKTNYFCWDLCYLPTDDVSAGSLTVASDSTNGFFSGHILSLGGGVEGSCTIDYTFFNENDANDTLRVTITFIATNSLSVDEESYSSFQVYPNPATDFLNVSYEGFKTAEFEMINLVGQRVFNQTLESNDDLRLDVSSLQSGVYFYTLTIEGKLMETKKLVIK